MNKTVEHLAMSKILVREDKNCRDLIHTAEFLDLANSISQNGLLMPIIVRPVRTEDKYLGFEFELVAGFRRFRAHQFNQSELIWAMIDPTIVEDEQFVTINLIENLNRANLTIKEEAKAVKYYMSKGYSRPMIATIIAQPLSWIETRTKFAELPEDAQDVVVEYKFNNNQINQLYKLRNDKDQMYTLVREYKSNKQKAGKLDKHSHEIRNLQKARYQQQTAIKKTATHSKEELIDLAEHLENELGLNTGSYVALYCSGEISMFKLHNLIKELHPTYIIPSTMNLSESEELVENQVAA